MLRQSILTWLLCLSSDVGYETPGSGYFLNACACQQYGSLLLSCRMLVAVLRVWFRWIITLCCSLYWGLMKLAPWNSAWEPESVEEGVRQDRGWPESLAECRANHWWSLETTRQWTMWVFLGAQFARTAKEWFCHIQPIPEMKQDCFAQKHS